MGLERPPNRHHRHHHPIISGYLGWTRKAPKIYTARLPSLGLLHPSHRAAPDFVINMTSSMKCATNGIRLNKDLAPLQSAHPSVHSTRRTLTPIPPTSANSTPSCLPLLKSDVPLPLNRRKRQPTSPQEPQRPAHGATKQKFCGK